MTTDLFNNPLSSQPTFPLSLWQKRQATLLYYWMSFDYLKGLKGMIDKLMAGSDVLLDLAKSQGRDALIADERWGVRDTSANWSTYGHSALADFRKSTIRLLAWRTNESYCGTGAHQCGYLLGETSSRWMTEEEEERFNQQFEAIYAYATRIDEVSGAGGQKYLDDRDMIAYWQEYGSRFPRLPRFRVRADVVGETGKLPPRTGVYVPQDDPYGTLQFAWTGNSDGILGKAQTYNDAGLAAVKVMGRNAIWQDEQKMMAYVIEALKQKRLQPANGFDWKEVDDLDAAWLVLSPQAFTEHPCKWYFVEMIDGEFDDATEDETAIEPVYRPNVPAGSPCPESGWWFTPAQPASRRYFKQGAVMPALGSDYGDTYWQWSPDQSAPTL
ncbi:hypothetical protein [uncultured Dechloromonas sp.]|uniref:hypothetical protein n=1 Tax=uncultured Dechloromonas sp. TaxID=171719 RepID=UPI0025F9F9FA|nr:hypothetical protein [uncultured Dechloromonas sp.]